MENPLSAVSHQPSGKPFSALGLWLKGGIGEQLGNNAVPGFLMADG
jgi:hypothetical protein